MLIDFLGIQKTTSYLPTLMQMRNSQIGGRFIFHTFNPAKQIKEPLRNGI